MTMLPDALAAQLFRAQAERTALARSAFPDALRPNAAYAVQAQLDRLARQAGRAAAGWKIGLTSPGAQAKFGASAPMLGVIYADTLRESGASLDLSDLVDPRIEGEILLEIGCPPRADATDAALLVSLASVRAAFEIADSRIAGWPADVGQAIADNACCGLVIAAATGVEPARLDFTGARSVLKEDDSEIAAGTTGECLGGILAAYRWLIGETSRLGQSLRAGDVVLCGAMGAPAPLHAGRTYRLAVDGLDEVSLQTKGIGA